MRFQRYITETTKMDIPFWELTESNDIMSWFKGSEARRGKKPLTLYRGISKTVEDRHASAALGIFATDDLNVAKSYGSKVLKVYMKITNPYYMEYDEIQEIENKQDALRVKKELMKKGYDGVFLKPIKGSGSSPYAVKEYIAFNKNQVKEVE